MYKKIYLFLFLPLAMFAQEVFASEFSHNSYYVQSPSTSLMSETIPNLQQNVINYNSNLKNTLKNIQRNPYDSVIFNENLHDSQNVLRNSKNNLNNQNFMNQSNIFSQDLNRANNLNFSQQKTQISPKETIQPQWWRQENTFEGWGFD